MKHILLRVANLGINYGPCLIYQHLGNIKVTHLYCQMQQVLVSFWRKKGIHINLKQPQLFSELITATPIIDNLRKIHEWVN
ncbi:hypothetical protein FGO68_gene7814 [Halteria grandinella]|uniref:Uncharacterized protein n=1 Tax=Halteria grandinella TaxID=5974 RepID=A0A8J8P1W7_HALGN|nr:hypothetical protein FGO68_gene7814 [Halteria grandinella]